MLIEESIWIRRIFDKYFSEENFPLLNIGSSTANFRENVQAHIEENIFTPLKEKKRKIIHLDMKMDEGVDIIGDLSDDVFRDTLKEKGVKSILCSNLLEHLEDPKPICNSIVKLLQSNDLIIITVPYYFPFHKDPIDTMLRPSIEELALMFPGTQIIESSIVEENNCFKKVLFGNKKYFFNSILRWGLPFYKFREWRLSINDLFHWKRKFSATCILLKKV